MAADEPDTIAGAGKARLPKPVPARQAGGVAMIRPIGPRVRAEYAPLPGDEAFRTALEMMKEGYALADAQGVILFASAPLAAMLGCSPHDLVGRSLFGFFDPAQRETVASALRDPDSHERISCDAMFTCADGKDVPVRVAMKRVVSTGTGAVSCCAVVTEISAEVQISQALQKSAHDLQRVSHQVLTAQESERQRIAADLHDGLGQLLGAVKFGLESVLGSADTHGRQEARATLSSVASTVKEALEEVRRLAMNLRPSTLDDLGLLATLSWFVREFQGVYRSIAVETDFRIDESDVEDGLKVAIFRVVQEAMNNIAKHSRATRARICLERDGAGLRMTVEDNGVGFSQADVASRQGVEKRHGHACSRDRVEWSGGTYSVDAAPGRGVRIKVSWPSARNAVTGPSQGTDNATTLAHHDRRGPHAAADRIAGAAEPGRRT